MATMIQHSFLQQCPSLSAFPNSPLSSPSISLSTSRVSLKFKVYSCCQTSPSPLDVVNGNTELRASERTEIRFGLPSKGRMASDTLELLKDCQLSVRQVNPRQYVAQIPQISNLEVWFQRPKDIVRKLLSGDLDLGIVGFDIVNEYAQMGIADAILDLVSSGTTLKENNLKEIEGGVVLQSQAVLIASRKSLTHRNGVLDTTHEILERFEAHLRASGQFTVTANMRGSSAEEVAERIINQSSLSGLQGPTISPVFCKRDGKVTADYYAIVICVPKKELYMAVQQLRAIGGSGVLISPLTYIFEEETPRWCKLLAKLGH